MAATGAAGAASSPLVYYRLFTPEEIAPPVAEFRTNQLTRSTTQLRIGPDNDGEKEKVFKLTLLNPAQAQAILPPDENITIVIRLGSAIVPNKRDPLYVMISDDNRAIGFKISESGPIKGVEGEPGRYLDIRGDLKGDDNETAALNPRDWPDEFVITLKPNQYWGTIFCAQGNGTKQCVGFGHKLHFRSNGMFLDVYRHLPIEEYIINYIEVKVFVNNV